MKRHEHIIIILFLIIPFWYLGDIITTIVGVEYFGIVESNPYLQGIVHNGNYIDFVLLKTICLLWFGLVIEYTDIKNVTIPTMYFVGFIGVATFVGNCIAILYILHF